jgi:hypothetical protein
MYPIKCACYTNGEERFNTFELYVHTKYWNRKEMRKGRHVEAEDEEERKVDAGR